MTKRGLTPKERIDLHSEVDPLSGCWVWTGARNTSQGTYGRLWVDGKVLLAHRVSYEEHVGPIPNGAVIDHLCNNMPCVNPAHLEPKRQRANVLRGSSPPAVHARKTHCLNGHAFDAANTYVRSNGYRECRKCNAKRKARSRAIITD
jgi:hypothetical protein